ncbi:MAG: bifunctional phosphopantothenoylcysteine decarboxylase/phosphopantothenate--cysteine ligase CoaBC [Lachnospiraceae bacterium]|nr:bifunctional phosphopantothenoylcysteine decarboxylase/phosphopantothenate--cysteine ligase CoaBC [Lachnospiraceae bacterium]MBO4461386.1 bifunctional phosphopantothenoylcysteine decarboxylase/phosphopantothenate--cysteine ligase CoaBC [Lachnospiraceae bacterium]
MLKGKTVVLGVTGSIAAYKIASLASALIKLHADVHVIMTENATKFINPITFETLTRNKCIVDTFDRNFSFEVEHVSLGQKADIMMIAPASANIIGKLANGIADDMLSTVALAMRAPIYISPAMNTAMYENKIVQDNIEKCKSYGMHVIDPAEGFLACRDVGAGKMPEPEELLSYIMHEIACKKDLAGKKVLVTAGPTLEAIDPVRYITNHSSGKMGYAIAENAMLRGAEVYLVSGPTSLKDVPFVHMIRVSSAADMAEATFKVKDEIDYFFLSAAVADYRPIDVATEKIKKSDGDMSIKLERTTDILKTLGESKKDSQFLCGFCMETEDLVNRAKEKLVKKNADLIVANSIKQEGAGFKSDTNIVTLIAKDYAEELPILSKKEIASKIIDYALGSCR